MKKLFFCASLIACSIIVNAQQKTTPSFRNYLNNEKSLPPYNPRMYSPPVKSEVHIEALTNGIDLKIDQLKKFLDKIKRETTLYSGHLASSSPKGNNLVLLPQDNMPCIVPDQSQFNMPVAKGNNELDKKINVINP